jgi:hypothetical protein
MSPVTSRRNPLRRCPRRFQHQRCWRLHPRRRGMRADNTPRHRSDTRCMSTNPRTGTSMQTTCRSELEVDSSCTRTRLRTGARMSVWTRSGKADSECTNSSCTRRWRRCTSTFRTRCRARSNRGSSHCMPRRVRPRHYTCSSRCRSARRAAPSREAAQQRGQPSSSVYDSSRRAQ